MYVNNHTLVVVPVSRQNSTQTLWLLRHFKGWYILHLFSAILNTIHVNAELMLKTHHWPSWSLVCYNIVIISSFYILYIN